MTESKKAPEPVCILCGKALEPGCCDPTATTEETR